MTIVNFARGERLVRRIDLVAITTSHNPRRPAPELQDALVDSEYDGWTVIDLIQNLALSDDPAKKAEYVRLIETHESGSRGILELAGSRRKKELQSIQLRSFRVKDGDEYFERYGVVVGERRLMAAAYNHAKHGDSATIGADSQKMTVDAAEDFAFDENMQRKDMTALEIGEWIRHRYEIKRVRVKVENEGRPKNDLVRYDLKAFGVERDLDYQFVRSRYSLTHLPENLKARVERGTLGITEAAKIGREIKNGKRDKDGSARDGAEVGQTQNGKVRVITVTQVNELFDKARGGASNDFLKGLCACVKNADGSNLTLRQALRESDKRGEELELREAKQREKELRRRSAA